MTQEELNKAYELGYNDGMGLLLLRVHDPAKEDGADLKWNEYYLEGFADGQADYDREMQALYQSLDPKDDMTFYVLSGTDDGANWSKVDTYVGDKLPKDE